MDIRTTGVVAGLILSVALTGTAAGETTPEDAVKYRQAVMESMKGHIAALSLLAFGRVEDAGYMQSHATALATLGKELRVLFPAGSGDGKTHALPAIWEEPDRFAGAIDDAAASAAELSQAVENGDRRRIAAAFKKTGDSCKGCHERYREEHDH